MNVNRKYPYFYLKTLPDRPWCRRYGKVMRFNARTIEAYTGQMVVDYEIDGDDILIRTGKKYHMRIDPKMCGFTLCVAKMSQEIEIPMGVRLKVTIEEDGKCIRVKTKKILQ